MKDGEILKVATGGRAIVLLVPSSQVPLASGIIRPDVLRGVEFAPLWGLVLDSRIDGIKDPEVVDGHLKCEVVLLPQDWRSSPESRFLPIETNDRFHAKDLAIIDSNAILCVLRGGKWEPWLDGTFVLAEVLPPEEKWGSFAKPDKTDVVGQETGVVLQLGRKVKEIKQGDTILYQPFPWKEMRGSYRLYALDGETHDERQYVLVSESEVFCVLENQTIGV